MLGLSAASLRVLPSVTRFGRSSSACSGQSFNGRVFKRPRSHKLDTCCCGRWSEPPSEPLDRQLRPRTITVNKPS